MSLGGAKLAATQDQELLLRTLNHGVDASVNISLHNWVEEPHCKAKPLKELRQQCSKHKKAKGYLSPD